MLIGGNNLNTMFDNYEDILIGFKENSPYSKVILLSLTAMRQSLEHKNEIVCFNNVKMKLLADKYGYSFVDLFTPLFDINTNEIYSDYTIDDTHLSAKGYEVITNIVTPVIENLLRN